MGASQSSVFDYEAQLLADTSKIRSIEVKENGEAKGETLPRRNPLAKDGLWKYPFSNEDGGLKSIWECFQRSVKKYPDNKCFGTRKYEYEEKKETRGEYVFQSYKEADLEIRQIASGMVALGAKKDDNIGIFSNNRAEWVETAFASYSQTMRVVSLYATLGADAVEYIINHAETHFVFVSKENIKGLLKTLPKVKNTITHIIQYDPHPLFGNVRDDVDPADVKACEAFNIKLIGFSELRKLGEEKMVDPVPPQEDDLAVIMYTSGTTGTPKGALLSHLNIISAVSCVPAITEFGPDDRMLSYLPLAHILESVFEILLYVHGGSVWFYQGNVKKLTDDICACRPTILPGVPRVFSRIRQKVLEGVEAKSWIVRWYFNRAYTFQTNQLRQGLPLDQAYDTKVFGPIRDRVGLGSLKCLLSGGAPAPAYLIEFLKVLAGNGPLIVQGYGMTENAAGACVTQKGDHNLGHNGPPLPNLDIKLVDIPEMGYLSTDKHPRGEVWMRGASVFKGYYKDPETTASTLIDGWLATGDVGRWNPNGTLSIIDRKKNMFKLAQGEYVAAEKIEHSYARAPLVGQLWIYGNSFKNTVLGIVVPAAEPVSEIMKKKGWWPSDDQSAPGSQEFADTFHKVAEAHKAELKALMLENLREQEKDLKGFEKAADFMIETNIDRTFNAWNEANECLTPTFKLRRNNLLKRYLKDLKEMYGKLGEPCNADEKWPGEN